MATQQHCGNETRRNAVRSARGADGRPALNGIDFLEVAADQRTLHVHFLHPLPGQPDGVPAAPVLAVENLRVEGGVRVRNISAVSVTANANVLDVATDASGDYSTYQLRLISSPSAPDLPPEGFDPRLSLIVFSFKVDCPGDFDCLVEAECPPDRLPPPVIDYLARDYGSFRRLMLDRLSVTMPEWRERSPADVGVALVELLAYAADRVSYFQDAVATEAYLGTARRRTSLRRHARLLDYPLREGVNARAWVCFTVTGDDVQLPAGQPLLTRLDGLPNRLAPDSQLFAEALGRDPLVFETLHPAALYEAHNEVRVYTWGDENCCLPAGATRATLRDGDNGRLRLVPGDVLVFEERRGVRTGLAQDADPAHRHAVRLTTVRPAAERSTVGGVETRVAGPAVMDPLNGQPIVEIEWHAADALPFPLCLSTSVDGAEVPGVSVALGNVVLTDHGRTIAGDELVPAASVEGERYRPRLRRAGVAYAVEHDDERARLRPASEALRQSAGDALASISLQGGGQTWQVRRDLLNSDPFDAGFVVEREDNGQARLRFGDGVLGLPPQPGTPLRATYRVGGGRAGNVGFGAIAHAVTLESRIAAVRNPLPALGGEEPEPASQARLYAPQAFRTQERAVTAADYAAVAERHPEVQKAAATLRWTGSWYTVFLTVDRAGGRDVTASFEAELRGFLERFRLAGHDLEIDAPSFVPLDVSLAVCVLPGHQQSDVRRALLQAFSRFDRPTGPRGFFHPDNFTFGQPVYLSQVVATAMRVEGVERVTADRFQRWGQLPQGELDDGRILLGRLEIARLDNDPSQPENGRIELSMGGGR